MRKWSSNTRKVRTDRGPSQSVMQKVIRVAPAARMPMGTNNRRRPKPRALMAMSSLSADMRPRAISTPTRTPIGKVKLRIPGSVQRNRMPSVDQDDEWRTTKSIRRTNCGTKKTNEKIPSPNNAWEKTWRQMYRSMRRIKSSGHSSTPANREREPAGE